MAGGGSSPRDWSERAERMLTPDEVTAMVRPHGLGWGNKRIAAELGSMAARQCSMLASICLIRVFAFNEMFHSGCSGWHAGTLPHSVFTQPRSTPAVAPTVGLALAHRAAGIAGGYPRGSKRRRRHPRRPRSSAWFAHRHWTGILTGIEMRGPTWRSFSTGGDKTLFRLPGAPCRPSRVAVCEAAIDALSLAAIESRRLDTLYTATAGGMSPATITALQQLLEGLASAPAGTLIAATDADIAGRRYAARLQRMTTEARVRFDAVLPADGAAGTAASIRRSSGHIPAPSRCR
jgi:hypothetical protein